jgi:Domain of unknown function (DUF4208)
MTLAVNRYLDRVEELIYTCLTFVKSCQQCKERMRAVKRSLKHLGDPDPKLSDKEKLMHTRECLLRIGNRIGDILSEFKDPKKIKEWKRWIFGICCNCLKSFFYR